MTITNYGTKNSFATFSLRGRRPQKCGGGVVSCASFLKGVVASVVLGSAFALSAPAFAQNTTRTVTLSTDVFIEIADMYATRTSYSVNNYTYTAGPFIRIQRLENASGEGSGASLSLGGNGSFRFENIANIDGLNHGIEITHNGPSNLIFTNKGNITDTENWGIRIAHTSTGGIQITNESTVEGDDTGIHAEHVGTGGIQITNESTVEGDDTGIHAEHAGTGGIQITNESTVEGDDTGIHAEHVGTGDVGITNESYIWGSDIGIHADHSGTGDIGITNERYIWISDIGIHADHSGTGDIGITHERYIWGSDIGIRGEHGGTGDIGITNEGYIWASDIGIRGEHGGTGDIGITNEGYTWGSNIGIRVEHVGIGDIGITNEDTVRAGDTGIHTEHVGTGDIGITNEDTVRAGDTGIHTEHAGTGDIGITNEDTVGGDDTGIHAEHAGTGDIGITNEDTVNESNIGIHANHTGTGNIGITSKDSVSGDDTAIHAVHAGTGDVGIINEGSISGDDTGIHAGHTGTGNVVIANEDSISVSGDTASVHAEHTGAGDVGFTNKGSIVGVGGIASVLVGHAGTGDIGIINESRIWGLGTSVHAGHAGTGDIGIVNKNYIWGTEINLHAEHTGTGDIRIINEGLIGGGSRNGMRIRHTSVGDIEITNKRFVGGMDFGIRAEHIGTGDIGITNEDAVRGSYAGIYADHDGNGIIDIDILSGGSATSSGKFAIHADHTGTGIIDIDILSGGSATSTRKSGIFVERGGTLVTNTGNETYDVHLDVKGAVRGYEKGIVVNQNRAGDVVFKIDDGGESKADWSYGIEVTHTSTGEITIDLSGTISGGNDTGPVHMNSSGTKTLVLRPGFELKSGQNHVDIVSVGGVGILELNQDDDRNDDQDNDTPHISETLNFGAFEFQGFNRFEKKGGNVWRIYGVASDAEMFDRATIWEGTLRFMGGVTFKMSSAEPTPTSISRPGRPVRPNYFRIDDDGVLEVVGNNILDGNLNNLGKIVFMYDPNGVRNSRNPNGRESTLTIEGGYKGGGELVFDVSSGRWQNDKLTIGGDKDLATVTGVTVHGAISNFSSAANEYLPMQIEVTGDATAGSFEGRREIDNYNYVLSHYSEADEQDSSKTIHRWKFHKKGHSSLFVQGSSLTQELSDSSLESQGTSPASSAEGSGLGLRADTSRYVGGVWGRQRSLRTSRESGVIAGVSSRKEDSRVYFGYDTPAMSFMGGDMIVGTNVWHGLSVSDVSSSAGKSGIGMESHAAALSASWWSPDGFYVDGRTQYVRSSNNISAERFVVVRGNEGTGTSASTEAGYRLAVPLGGMDFSVAPQVQLLWSRVNFDDFAGLTGEVVSLEDGELVIGRLGFSWDGEWQDAAGSGRTYGEVNLHGAIDGKTIMSISNVPLSRERSDLSADGRLGVSYEWDGGYTIRGEVSAVHRDDAEEIRADIGMNFNF